MFIFIYIHDRMLPVIQCMYINFTTFDKNQQVMKFVFLSCCLLLFLNKYNINNCKKISKM